MKGELYRTERMVNPLKEDSTSRSFKHRGRWKVRGENGRSAVKEKGRGVGKTGMGSFFLGKQGACWGPPPGGITRRGGRGQKRSGRKRTVGTTESYRET